MISKIQFKKNLWEKADPEVSNRNFPFSQFLYVYHYLQTHAHSIALHLSVMKSLEARKEFSVVDLVVRPQWPPAE